MKKLIYITSATLLIAIFSLSSIAQPWTWSEDTLSYARAGMSATTIDDTIFYSGGKMTNGTFSNIWDIYDIGEDQWDTYETSSNPRWNSATVSAGGKVISAGGSNYSNWDNFADVDIYDKETGEWNVEYLSLGRTIMGAVASGNMAFFPGGHIHIYPGSMDYTDTIDIYDTETNTWFIDNLSIPRGFIGGVAAGGKIYFAGGATGEQAVTNRIDIYNMETGEWTIDSLSEAKGLIAAVAYGDKIYFAGGAKPYGVTSTLIEVYNITTSSWEDSMNLQASRLVTALNVENSLVFTGVCDYFAFTGVGYLGPANGVVEIYYPETNQWEYSVTNLNPARFLYAPISYGNKAYYAGGWISAMTDKISILEYTGQCLPEGITFSTQAEIDSFQINYPDCTEIEGDVTINGEDIANLYGLDVITAIGGMLLIGDTLYPYNGNPILPNLEGLESLTTIGGSLKIMSNQVLVSFLGLNNLTSIGESLHIVKHGNLTTLTGLDNLTSIGGDLLIGGGVGLDWFGNPSLTSITALSNLTSIGGNLLIGGNGLVNLTGLENLTSLPGSISIGWGCGQGSGYASNQILESLSGLDNLTSIGGYLSIQHCPVLTNLTGLENLAFIGLDLSFGCNSTIVNLSGLDNLNSVEGILIGGNSALSSLSGMDNLTTIGYLQIGVSPFGGNSSLTNLAGLESLTSLAEISIGGNTSYSGNPNLVSLSGLDNIGAGTIENIKIRYNNSLSDCDVQSICDYLAAPNGEVEIHDNAEGCNDSTQIVNACNGVSITEINFENSFTISPNPTSGFVNLRYTIYDIRYLTLDILNVSGTKLKSLKFENCKAGTHETEIDVSNIPAGVYFCVLKTNNGMQTKKIIKL